MGWEGVLGNALKIWGDGLRGSLKEFKEARKVFKNCDGTIKAQKVGYLTDG